MPIYELDGQAPELPGEGRFYVTENAVLIGRVRLKAETSVWFGAVIRGDGNEIRMLIEGKELPVRTAPRDSGVQEVLKPEPGRAPGMAPGERPAPA